MKRRVVALAVLIAGCGSATDPASSPLNTTTPASVVTAATSTTDVVSAAEPFDATITTTTTTTTVPYREIRIVGTGKVYTLEEAQAFGEFGPLLWNLVTTLNGTDRIEHGPRHEWVIWGPMWGGRIAPGDYTYGVTDLDAVDAVAVAAAVPTGQAIVLREVPWSLDELNDYSDRLRDIASSLDTNRCGIGWGTRPGEGLHIQASSEHAEQITATWKAQGLPLELLHFELICFQLWSGLVLVEPEPSEFNPE